MWGWEETDGRRALDHVIADDARSRDPWPPAREKEKINFLKTPNKKSSRRHVV